MQNVLCFGYARDSQISKCLTREWSARGGADRCDDMHSATTSGIGSKTFCRAVKAMWAARRRTIACSSKLFSSGFAPASLDAICPSALATGRSSISASTDGPKSGVFERVFRLLASDHDNEYMMIDATIVRAHRHSAGAQKKTARKPSADPAVD